MFSSVAGGSICVGCQLRAVSRRTAAATKLTAAHSGTRSRSGPRRRNYTSAAARKQADQNLEAILSAQRHNEEIENPKKKNSSWAGQRPQSKDDWDAISEEELRKEADRDRETDLNARRHSEDVKQDGKKKSDSSRATQRQQGIDDRDSVLHGAGGDVEQQLVRKVDSRGRQDPPLQPAEPTMQRIRKGNTALHVDSSKLSIPTLGREAEVIVLREGGRWVRKPLNWDRRAPDRGLVLEEALDQEVGLDMELVLDNIDALRPEHRILPASEFKTVFDCLMNGFTSVQLQAYLARHQQRIEDGEESAFLGRISEPTQTLPWIVEQAIWTPHVEGAVEDIPQSLKGYILKTMPPKQRLAMQLMRQCWAMSVQELMDGQGILEVPIRDQEFKLLTLGHQRFLRALARNNLSGGKGKALEVIKSRQTIRFLAPKAVSEQCLNYLDEVLQKTKSKAISMDAIPLKNLETAIFEELGRMSNSLVEPDEQRREVTVTWLHTREDDPEGKLENISDVVFRLLQTAHPSSRIDTSLTVLPDSGEKANLIEDITSKDKLSWMDRRAKWARLCLPLARKEPKSTVKNTLDKSILQYKVQPIQQDFELPKSVLRDKEIAFFKSLEGMPLFIPKGDRPKEEPPIEKVPLIHVEPTSSGWLPFRVRTNAVFGHVLHPFNTDVSHFTPNNIESLSKSYRVIAPLIPPVDEISLPGWVPYRIPSNLEAYLILRFNPFSDDATKPPDPLAPQLELRIKASAEDVIEIDCLHAISHTHVADVCLPSQFVDVRTTQRLVAKLPGRQLDFTDGMQPLTEFLRDAMFQIQKAKLITPPRLANLGLPRWMFYRPEADLRSPFLGTEALERLKQTRKQGANAAGGAPAHPLAFDEMEPGKPITPYQEQIDDASFNSLRHVSYIFAGLEVHRPIITTFDGWRLTYTSIEAGQGGGRRAELSLRGSPGPDKMLRRGAEHVDSKSFLRSVYALACGAPGHLVQRPGDSEGEGVQTRIGWVGKGR